MKAIKFPQCNAILTAPPGKEGEVFDLHVCQTDTGGENPQDVTVVAWLPNQLDLERMRQGEPIYVLMWGHRIPPHSVQTGNPFEENKVTKENVEALITQNYEALKCAERMVSLTELMPHENARYKAEAARLGKLIIHLQNTLEKMQ
jgi:hypothetical protein